MTCIDCAEPTTPLGIMKVTPRGTLHLDRCESCRLVVQREWRDEFVPELNDYYADWMGRPEQVLYPDLNHRRILTILERLDRESGEGRRLLDVGCGHGGIIRAAVEAQWNAEGIELSKPAIAIAEQFGLPCTLIDFFDHSLDDREYDVIVMSELIEHVPHPRDFLLRARELLAPNGLIYLTTPNWNSVGRRILGAEWPVIHPGHLAYFTPGTLRRSARSAGLRVDRVWTEHLSLDALRKLRGGGSPPVGGREAKMPVREAIEASRTLRLAKAAANVVFRATGTGENMKAILRRPQR